MEDKELTRKITPKDFKKRLTKFDKILVSGPQRSGTRVCAKMISQDIGHFYIDEVIFDYDRMDVLDKLMDVKTKMVFHCPAIAITLEAYSRDDTAIIFMMRNVGDIIASQTRINWTQNPKGGKLELQKYGEKHGVISQIKYNHWETVQKEKIKNWFEIEYDSLREHPLWVPKKDRKDFEWDQTEIKSADKK